MTSKRISSTDKTIANHLLSEIEQKQKLLALEEQNIKEQLKSGNFWINIYYHPLGGAEQKSQHVGTLEDALKKVFKITPLRSLESFRITLTLPTGEKQINRKFWKYLFCAIAGQL